MLARVPALIASSIFVAQVSACGLANSECRTDAECGSGQRCVYPIKDGCSAKGQCEDLSTPRCNLITTYCGCDGSTVSVSCGYSGGSAPVAGPDNGSCPHGTKDAGGPCTTSADCGLNQGCYYPIANGCSATGVCLEDVPGIASNVCLTGTVYCGCNGQTQLVCAGHDGYVEAPVSGTRDSSGSCSGSLLLNPDGGSQM